MAGISAETCISLILSRIGGIPLRPATTSIMEGSPPAKQIGGIANNFPSLNAMAQSLNGVPLSTINAGIFQNPIAAASTALASSIPTSVSSLQSMAGTFDPVTGTYSGGVLSLSQVNALTTKLNGSTLGSTLDPLTGLYTPVTNLGSGGLSSGLTTLVDHTDKMSGLKIPNYENSGEFGFMQLTSMQSSMTSMTNQIPSALDAATGGVKSVISNKLTSVNAPLEMNSSLTSINSSVNDISGLSSLSGSALTNKYNEILAAVTSGESAVTTVVTDSKSSMTSLVTAADAASYPAVAAGVIASGETGPVSDTITKVVQPSVKTRIENDIKIYTVDQLNTAV